MIDRKEIIRLIDQSVAAVHAQNPHVLGVVFYGSRSRPVESSRGPRPDSDVDVVSLISEGRGDSISTLLTYTKAVVGFGNEVAKLASLGLHVNSNDVITRENLELAEQGLLEKRILHELLACMRYFDAHSHVITVDSYIREQFTNGVDQRWTQPKWFKPEIERWQSSIRSLEI